MAYRAGVRSSSTFRASIVGISILGAAALLGALSGCNRTKAPEPTSSEGVASSKTNPAPHVAETPSASSTPVAPPTVQPFAAARPAADRVVAIGDLHGDLEATRAVLRLAGLVDAKDAWVGGKTVVVQTGDEIDRGDGDRPILDLFEKLKTDAEKSGGAVIAMLGNHELMNASFDFRYVTPGGFSTFSDVHASNAAVDRALSHVEADKRGRSAAFGPGGSYASMLARRPVIVQVGDTLFVHGGVLPKHVTFGLDKINDTARDWLMAKISDPPSILASEDAPVWSRMYSAAPGPDECAILDKTLALAKAKRMVMGHTVQRNGINSACNDKAWRIDVGMSKFFGGRPEALELKGDTVTVLK